MTYAHGAHRQRQRVVPPSHDDDRRARTIIELANTRAARIIQVARIEAEAQASLIRERAYTEGRALADKEVLRRERIRNASNKRGSI